MLQYSGDTSVTCVYANQRRITPILRQVTFLVAFGVVLVAPRSGLCAIVYVRVASPLANPARQHNHNDVLVSRSRRADDVPGITRERRRE